jgi:hypothetical protein
MLEALAESKQEFAAMEMQSQVLYFNHALHTLYAVAGTVL